MLEKQTLFPQARELPIHSYGLDYEFFLKPSLCRKNSVQGNAAAQTWMVHLSGVHPNFCCGLFGLG